MRIPVRRQRKCYISSVPFRHAPGGADVFQKNRDAVPIRKVVVLRSLGSIKNRASWGCRIASDIRLWICTLRRARRLRSLLSRVMDTVRPRFPHRCVPKSVAGSDGRCTGGAQRCGFLGGAPGRKATLRDVHNGCDRCSPGLWLLTGRLLLTCSLWLDNSRYLWEAASNMTTEGWLRDLVLRAIVASPLSPRDAALLKEHLVGRLARRGHFRLREEKDGIAGTLGWAFLSILLNLAGDSECIALGLFATGLLIGVWGFIYCAYAGSSCERSSGAGSSSPRTRVFRRAVERNWCSRTITRPRWNQWLVSDGWGRQSSSWGVFRDGP